MKDERIQVLMELMFWEQAGLAWAGASGRLRRVDIRLGDPRLEGRKAIIDQVLRELTEELNAGEAGKDMQGDQENE